MRPEDCPAVWLVTFTVPGDPPTCRLEMRARTVAGLTRYFVRRGHMEDMETVRRGDFAECEREMKRLYREIEAAGGKRALEKDDRTREAA